MFFNICGVNSINEGVLFVLVDNVEMDINMLDFNDIEFIFVLKDVVFLVIYGVCVVFGVILVIIKKGMKDICFFINYFNNFLFSKFSNLFYKVILL